jgi:HPt (histidine-containing phosphotransfer) domain-containing protein
VRTAAHALTGMAASLGLTALSKLTGAIEQACLDGQTERVEPSASESTRRSTKGSRGCAGCDCS